MPLYDCMLLLKPHADKRRLVDLVARVGKHVYTRKGVLTDITSFGTVQLGYGIRKRDGRHFEGKLMQMTMMVPPSFPQELHYLNKEERLLRWLVVKHRDVKLGYDFSRDDDYLIDEIAKRPKGIVDAESDTDADDDSDDVEDDCEEGDPPVLIE